MNELFTLLFILFAAVGMAVAAYSLGRATGYEAGFAACSDIWANTEDDDVLDTEVIDEN